MFAVDKRGAAQELSGDQPRPRVRTSFGRTVTVCAGEAFVLGGADEKLVATMLVTIMTVGGHHGIPTTTKATSALGCAAHAR